MKKLNNLVGMKESVISLTWAFATAAKLKFLSSTFRTLINEGLFAIDQPRYERSQRWRNGKLETVNSRFFANNLPISSAEYCGRSSSHIDWHGTDFSANHDHKKVHPTPAIKIKLAEKGGGGWVLRREWCCA